MNQEMLFRIRVIDNCLRKASRKWTRDTLADACNEQAWEYLDLERNYTILTISRDLKRMKAEPPSGYGAPIEWDAQLKTYRYTDADYSIDLLPLFQEDINLLEEALGLIQSAPYFELDNGLSTLADRIAERLKLKRNRSELPPVVFSHSQKVEGQGWIPLLYEAVIRKHCVVLEYQPFEEPLIRQVVSPYLLREYNRRWFLIGYSHKYQKIRTYALDRVQEADQYLLEHFQMLPGFNPKRYFNAVVGVSVPEGRQPEAVRIRVTPLRAKYLSTKPIHASQALVEKTEAYAIFQLKVIPNIELERQILSMGEEVRVLQPEWLRQRIAERLKLAAEQYAKGTQ
ncbi:MAG: WYL domain-containing protein [Phaeodactylibacter sp.]|uniref:helix-turn-helix transcriptional regulator n=1 Tax=Phaeodactylibacter sp. TaxID=1940289 RepID=UPI0032F0984D